jgi:hypothetical protein
MMTITTKRTKPQDRTGTKGTKKKKKTFGFVFVVFVPTPAAVSRVS